MSTLARVARRTTGNSRSLLAAAQRSLCSDAVSPRELELLQQVSRMEQRVSELESQLPKREQPKRITNWEDLTFGILPVNGHVRHMWSSKTSSWDAGRLIGDPYINMHIHAGVLHYGMTLFEGCKAFRGKDGRVRVCNLNENSARMNTGASRLVMPSVPEKLFNDAVDWAVRANAEFVPPYGTGGSMYIRPFLMGTGPVRPAALPLIVLSHAARRAARPSGHRRAAARRSGRRPSTRHARTVRTRPSARVPPAGAFSLAPPAGTHPNCRPRRPPPSPPQ